MFQESLLVRDKDFHFVAEDLHKHGVNKSVKACVEFYYVWKSMNTQREVNR